MATSPVPAQPVVPQQHPAHGPSPHHLQSVAQSGDLNHMADFVRAHPQSKGALIEHLMRTDKGAIHHLEAKLHSAHTEKIDKPPVPTQDKPPTGERAPTGNGVPNEPTAPVGSQHKPVATGPGDPAAIEGKLKPNFIAQRDAGYQDYRRTVRDAGGKPISKERFDKVYAQVVNEGKAVGGVSSKDARVLSVFIASNNLKFGDRVKDLPLIPKDGITVRRGAGGEQVFVKSVGETNAPAITRNQDGSLSLNLYQKVRTSPDANNKRVDVAFGSTVKFSHRGSDEFAIAYASPTGSYRGRVQLGSDNRLDGMISTKFTVRDGQNRDGLGLYEHQYQGVATDFVYGDFGTKLHIPAGSTWKYTGPDQTAIRNAKVDGNGNFTADVAGRLNFNTDFKAGVKINNKGNPAVTFSGSLIFEKGQLNANLDVDLTNGEVSGGFGGKIPLNKREEVSAGINVEADGTVRGSIGGKIDLGHPVEANFLFDDGGNFAGNANVKFDGGASVGLAAESSGAVVFTITLPLDPP